MHADSACAPSGRYVKLVELLSSRDPDVATCTRERKLTMRRIDIAELEE